MECHGGKPGILGNSGLIGGGARVRLLRTHLSSSLVLEASRLSQLRRFLASALAISSAACFSSAAPAQTSAQQDQTLGQATDQPAPQTQQERAKVLRDAQARVNARRRMREEQIKQDTYSHKYELNVGGAYLRFHPGPNLQHNTEAAWNAGIAEWIRPKLAIMGDFRGYYGTAITNNFTYQVFKPSISQYTFMAGPEYRFYASQHWDWNAQVLAGLAHGNFSTGLGSLSGAPVGLYPDGNSFAVSVGAAVDYNLSPALAVRLMPNYLLTDFGSPAQENLGFTVGVVYRWGRQ